MKNKKEVDEIEYCDWCGEHEVYIGVYEDSDCEEESLVCKYCYAKMWD